MFTSEQAWVFLTPSRLLSKWYQEWGAQEESETSEPKIEAKPIVSMAYGASFINQIRAALWNDPMVQRGYDDNKEGMFKMPFFGRWATIVTGRYVEELAKAPDNYLSFQETINDMMQLELLIGPALSRDQIHLPAIRALTRRLSVVFPEIVDETHSAFATQMEKGKIVDGWISIKAFDAFSDLISQLHHRAFVGLPLCRDEKWNKTMVKSATELTIRALLLRPFPESRRADANEYMKNYGRMLEEGVNLLMPLLEQRRAVPEDERPNDLLTIIMSCVSEEEPDPKAIIGTFLLVDQVAQGTTHMTFMHALYYIVTHPEYVEELREEVQLVNGDGPLAYRSLEHLHKLDSFLRETQRLSGLSNFSMIRVALQDFEFSNGVKIPKGETVMAIGNPVHHDADVYEDPLEFKPFRFSERAQAEALGKGSKQYDMITPSPQFLAWGLGRHACPGRWYASMVVKHLMVYIITKYDVKLPDSAKGKRPADWNIMGSCVPNMTTQVLFKRRDDVDWE